ncbi:hypothetical protein LTR22_027592 [Elasticomyces elasticus]|nr:hypothetical protein LTR22_027592 [Elasticomyces elasticus]
MHRAVLEVERKFAGFAVPRLTADAGTSGFRDLRYLGQQSFTDIYYDDEDKLASNGVWLRKRQLDGKMPTWEAKCRRGGTFINSAFEEINDIRSIAALVRDMTGPRDTSTNAFGLKIIASLTTNRKSWCADDRFRIVLDLMDFGHQVGEVEQERTIMLPYRQGCNFDVTAWKRTITRRMDTEILDFMNHYHWAFRKEVPKGKLTAYFERHCQVQKALSVTPAQR